MSELIISNIYKSFGANEVLKGLTIEINKGNVYGIVGNNGCGKTTLFKILTEIIKQDSGDIFMRSGVKTGYLEQMPQTKEGIKVIDVLNDAFKDIHRIDAQMTEVANKISENPENEGLLKKYSSLQSQFEVLDGHSINEKLKKVTQGLKINEEMRKSVFQTLSGGEKTRILLATLLLKDTDILLLDEPTNHLDIDSIEWLERFINNYAGTILIISHDRYFLDKVSDYIVEIENGKGTLYKGNYSAFSLEKEKNREKQEELYERQQKEIKRIADRARQLHDWANNEKGHRKAFAMERRIEHMDKIERPSAEKKIKIGVNSKQFAGKEILRAEDITFRYDKRIFENASLSIYKDENTAIIGSNGCGKTTFLKLVLKELELEAGNIRIGKSAQIAYLPQNVVFERPERTIMELAQNELGLKAGEVRNLLAKYKFTGDDVFKEVTVLSGGEKSRLRLCILLQKNINILILDEPTNHLDIMSREVLEDMLGEFEGALMFVSHDRYFIRMFANRIVEIKDGKFIKYNGGYDLYKEEKELEEIEEEKREQLLKANEIKERQQADDEEKREKQKRQREKDPWRIKKLEEIENSITLKEEEIANIDEKLFSNITYEEICKLTEEKEKITLEIEELFVLWGKYS